MRHAFGPVKAIWIIVKKLSAVLLGILFLFSQGPALAQDMVGLKYWNELKQEAVTTESGLQYKALIMGTGKKPKATSKVNVHYRGLFLNGVVFDTSFDKDEPVTLGLGKVIKGWKEGIQLMPVGSVFVFLIPPELAYGERGTAGIPPNETLIFEVELFGFK